MAGTFPTPSYGTIALYPLGRALNMPIRRTVFLDDTEQRAVAADPLNGWKVHLSSIKKPDAIGISNFFESNKGDFDNSWTWGPIDGVTSTSMVFVGPLMSFPEVGENSYNLSFQIKETAISGTYPVGGISTYPTLASGAVVQFPFEAVSEFRNTVNDMSSGLRFAYYYRAASLKRWPLRYPLISDADALTLFDAAIRTRCGYRTFSFTDPWTGTTHTKVRFGFRPIERTYLGLGRNEVKLLLEEVP